MCIRPEPLLHYWLGYRFSKHISSFNHFISFHDSIKMQRNYSVKTMVKTVRFRRWSHSIIIPLKVEIHTKMIIIMDSNLLFLWICVNRLFFPLGDRTIFNRSFSCVLVFLLYRIHCSTTFSTRNRYKWFIAKLRYGDWKWFVCCIVITYRNMNDHNFPICLSTILYSS